MIYSGVYVKRCTCGEEFRAMTSRNARAMRQRHLKKTGHGSYGHRQSMKIAEFSLARRRR